MEKVENWVFWGVSKFQNVRIFRFLNNFFLENILFLIFFVETSFKSLSLFVNVSFVKSLKKKTRKKFPYKKFQNQFGKNRHIQNFETFFKNNLWIWSTCISIDVSFVPEPRQSKLKATQPAASSRKMGADDYTHQTK